MQISGPGRIMLLRRWSAINESFWFVPSLMAAVAVLVALGLDVFDLRYGRDIYANLPWMYNSGPEEARAMLSTIASSVITVAGTTFSITIAAVSLASQQYGPRRLRSFMGDRGTQVVLGTFSATFLYCLILLRSVHGPGEHTFVPHVALTGGIALAFASVGVLIYFIHHLASTLQIEQLIDNDAKELHAVVARVFVEGAVDDLPALPPENPALGAHVAAGGSGYVQVVDTRALAAFAGERDLEIDILANPGTYVAQGQRLAIVRGARTVDAETVAHILANIEISFRRTSTQDPLFAVQQLTEIAVRALSPGINAPYTAIICIDRLSDVIVGLAGKHMPAGVCDEAGRERVRMRPVTYADMLAASFDDIRRYGSSSVATVLALFQALARAGRFARTDEQRAALRRQIEIAACEPQMTGFGDADRSVIAAARRGAIDALGSAAAVVA